MGNIRLSYFKNSNGSAEVLEENNYYPFGLKHEGYNPTAGNNTYQYKYNGKELQTESGMLDYGWRQYMPELGRWNGMDQLSELYNSVSPYAYVANNPVMMFDPDGMKMIAHGGNGPDKDGNLDPDQLGGINNPYSIEEVVIQGNKKSSKGATPDIMMPVNCMVCYSGVGTTLPSFPSISTGINSNMVMATGVLALPTAGGASSGTWTAIRGVLGEIAGGLRAGLWGLPLMLNGDSQFAPNSKAISLELDIPGEISRGDNNRNGIILYRGVSSFAHTETQAIMYNEALFGIAIPNGLRPGVTAHWDMDGHAMGNNYSVFTSWTTSQSTARDFATAMGKAPGVILSKRFKIGVNAIPNVSDTGKQMQENEWLIFGPVIRANVQHVKP